MDERAFRRRVLSLGRELGLTGRESEVLFEFTHGLTEEEVGDALEISRHTVQSHRKNIHTKLQVRNRAELLGLVLRAALERAGDAARDEPGEVDAEGA